MHFPVLPSKKSVRKNISVPAAKITHHLTLNYHKCNISEKTCGGCGSGSSILNFFLTLTFTRKSEKGTTHLSIDCSILRVHEHTLQTGTHTSSSSIFFNIQTMAHVMEDVSSSRIQSHCWFSG